MVIVCGGPKGTGMQEVAQITIALKYLPYGKEVALITDGRFSGVSTGACIGHIGPEALDGGPIGKLKENDMIEINIDTINLEGSLDLIGENEENKGIDWGNILGKAIETAPALTAAFSSGSKEISFDVYQRTSDKPVLRILKNLKPSYFNEKFLIKDKNGNILKKSENLNQLINKTSWNNLRLVK